MSIIEMENPGAGGARAKETDALARAIGSENTESARSLQAKETAERERREREWRERAEEARAKDAALLFEERRRAAKEAVDILQELLGGPVFQQVCHLVRVSAGWRFEDELLKVAEAAGYRGPPLFGGSDQ
jgi:hypothetical protein